MDIAGRPGVGWGVDYRRAAFTGKPRPRGQCLLPGGSARALATQSHSHCLCLFCLGAVQPRASVWGGLFETQAYYRSMGEARPMPSACRFDLGIGRAGDSTRRRPGDAAGRVAAGRLPRRRTVAGRAWVGARHRDSARIRAPRRAAGPAFCLETLRGRGPPAWRWGVPSGRRGYESGWREAPSQTAPCLHY